MVLANSARTALVTIRDKIVALGVARVVVFLSLATGTASAQSIDYGQLQEMFGEPVTLSATGSPERASEAPATMRIITADEIRQSGAQDIPEILRFVAGVDVRQYGASDFDVGIRGYDSANSPRVLVLINGRQIYVDYHSYTAWQTLPIQLAEIRQIEVIEGPNAALFGFNAVGGVINIITYDPFSDKINHAEISGGSQGYGAASAVTTVPVGDWLGIRLSAGGFRQQEASTANQPASSGYGPFAPDAYKRSLDTNAKAKLSESTELTLDASFVATKQFEMTVGGYPGTTAYHVNSQKIGLGNESPLGDVNLTAYRNYTNFNYYPGGNYSSFTDISDTLYVVQLSDLFKIGTDHTVRYGVEYRNDQGGGSYFTGESFGFQLYSASAMWNWKIAPELALTNAVRLDHMTVSYQGPSPVGVPYTQAQYANPMVTAPSFNSALVYQPTGEDSFRLSVARGVQPPDSYDMFPEPVAPPGSGFVAGTGTAFEGVPNLKPSFILNYEVGYDRTLASLGSTLRVNLYDQNTTNVLAPPGDGGPPDPVTGYLYAANIGSSYAKGAEIELKGASTVGWRWDAAYSLSVITDRLTTTQFVDPLGSSIDFKHGTPVSAVVVGFGRSWSRVEADLHARWQSRFDDIAIGGDGSMLVGNHIHDYLTLDAHLGVRLTDLLSLGVTGQQLASQRIYATAGLPTERLVFATLSAGY